tara:strand:- start:4067 stop:4972 length:906 start_codon:yes stop_codon:yes gene_type:complete
MAKLKDVQDSMHNNPKEEEQVVNYNVAEEIANLAFEGSTKIKDEYIIFKLVDTKKKGRVYVDGIDDDIMNPITKKRERIWLLSGTSSIWSSELVEQLKDKDFVRNNRRSLKFEGGIFRVPSWDERCIEFIRNCRHLIDNPNRRTGSKFEFFEYNPAKQQEEALKREMLEIDMAIAAREMPMDKARKLASFLGVIFFDELGQPKTDDGIKRELMILAKRNPKKFQQNIDSKEVEVAYYIRKAIIESKISLEMNGNVTWATGGFITKIPTSQKAQSQKYLLELAMTNSSEGQMFLEQLMTKIK